MEDLLAQLRIIEQKIKEYTDKPKRHYINKIVTQSDYDIYNDQIDYTKTWFLITLTFDPKVVVNLDEYGQHRRLTEVINALNGYEYYSCIEKHKSGILHSHILIQNESVHELEEIMNKNKKHITKSTKLLPAIQIKTVKRTVTDLKRSLAYIFDDKKDHPIYKYLKINI